MPIFALSCPSNHEQESYLPSWRSENPACGECGGATERVLALSLKHIPGSVYPYMTSHISGKPLEVTSAAHLAQLCNEHGVVHRPDNGWIEQEYVGYDRKRDRQMYKEGSGRGMSGQWV